MIYAYRSLPRDYYEAIQGRFSRDDINNAVRTGPMNDALDVFSHAGHEFYSWDTDYDLKLSRRSNVRPLGRGMRLTLIDGFIFWVGLTESMKEMIDSYEDNIDSLADLENYQLLAEGLVELDTISAFFTSESQAQSHIKEAYKDIIKNPDNEAQRLLAEEIQREVYLEPYEAFATGFGLDDKGYYLAIVLLNPDEEVSRENTTILEKQIKQSKLSGGRNEEWSDIIDSVEIRRNGRLTLVKLYGRCSVYWNNFDLSLMLYEPLLIHK